MSIVRYIFLKPVSLVYGMVISVRNMLFDKGFCRVSSFNIPVICVGNITVGGTGKTPHVEYIAGLLLRSMQVAILSRGYLRHSRGFHIVSADDEVNMSGDEPLQLARRLPKAVVAVDRDRVHGVRKLLSLFPDLKAIILDDGFQHRSLKAGMNIILTSHGRLMTDDSLLPYGRLRDNLSSLRRANIIVVTKAPEQTTDNELKRLEKEINPEPGQRLFFTTLSYGSLLPVFPGPQEKELTENTEVLLVTGIADPSPLVYYISQKTSHLRHLSFSDHHNFTEGDIDKISDELNSLKQSDKIIVTTEKDSVRLKEFTNIAIHFKEQFYYIPIRVRFLENEEEFINAVTLYARENN